jgi:hypothetical protein
MYVMVDPYTATDYCDRSSAKMLGALRYLLESLALVIQRPPDSSLSLQGSPLNQSVMDMCSS